VIQEKNHNHLEIYNKWLHAINKRLTDDKITASMIKCNKGFTTLVVNTWEHVLSKDRALPNSWISVREVLVGKLVGRDGPRSRALESHTTVSLVRCVNAFSLTLVLTIRLQRAIWG
jgi:hypothetical protein